VVQELKELGTSADEKKALARLLVEDIRPIDNNTTASARAKTDRSLLAPILDDLDKNMAASVGGKIKAVDQLSKLQAQNATDKTMQIGLGDNGISTAINPMGTGSRRLSFGRSEKEVTQLSDLIGNPTPENLDKLRRMAEIDPRARRALQWISTWAGVSSSSASREK
jgi:hypothetical protein